MFFFKPHNLLVKFFHYLLLILVFHISGCSTSISEDVFTEDHIVGTWQAIYKQLPALEQSTGQFTSISG